MNGKNDILEELRSLSALVASINRETPYQAPEGYFLSFPTLLLEKVQTVLPRESKPLTFSIPEGYFDGFAQQVLDRIKSGSASSAGIGSGSSADMGLAPSAGMGSASSARMGEDETLPAILVQAGRGTPYKVPEGYFEALSPVLAILKNKNPYLVPAGYFDQLAAGVVAEVFARTAEPASDHGHSKARVIGFGKRMNWMKYAAAAVVAGLIVTIGLLRSHTSTPPLQIAGIPQSPVEIAKNLSKVSDAELQNFLVEQDTTLAQPVTINASMATINMDDNDIKSLLGDIPDGELKQYLDEQGGTNDIATN